MTSGGATDASIPQVLAVRFGTVTRPRSATFHRYADFNEPDTNVQMDYFFWVVRVGSATIVVDSGFDPPAGERRGAITLLTPREALSRLGIRGEDVGKVIVTHFHYDHIGNLDAFPNAELVVGAPEFELYTGPLADRLHFRKHVEAAEIAYIADAHRAGRVRLVDERAEVAPGVTAIAAPGHAPGQLIVGIDRPERDVVLASDAVHLYEELENDRPFSVLTDLVKMYETFEDLRELQRNGAVVLPGHDPAVTSHFPTLDGDAEGVAYTIA